MSNQISYITVPLIYNNNINVANITNLLLIDNTIRENTIFINNCNMNTLSIVYNRYSNRKELKELLLNKFSLTQLSRIAFVFHNSNMNSKLFLNNDNFFENTDFSQNTDFSENVKFIIDLIKEFNIKHIDYLACNSLQYENWNKYYNILKINTNVIVGASNDQTGNIKYGGNWLMENTLEDVKSIYFNPTIENYTSTLATVITINGGLSTDNNIYIKQLTNGNIYYSTTNNSDDNINTGTWTQINAASDWQVEISNTNSIPSEENRLTVYFLTNIILLNINNQLNLKTQFITIDGYDNSIDIRPTGWFGFIGTIGSIGNITVRRINIIGNYDILATSGGYYGHLFISYYCQNCQGTNIVEYITNNIGSSSGYKSGIFSGFAFENTTSDATNIVRFCRNNGQVGHGGITNIFCFRNGSANKIQNCFNTGILQNNNGAGILGTENFQTNANGIKNTIENCYNTGALTAITSGIVFTVNPCTIQNCYNIGTIADVNSQIGIYSGSNSFQYSNFFIKNCYTLFGKITFDNKPTVTNCYEANGNWLTSAAMSNLIIDTDVWGYNKSNNVTNTTLPFVLLSLNPTNVSVLTNMTCFNKGSKILTSTGYVQVQDLKKGDLVKTLLHDFISIDIIGSRDVYNPSGNERIVDRLYICSNSEFSEITEDLIITGGHSILVDEISDDQERNETIKLLGGIHQTEGKCRLPVCIDKRTRPYDKEGSYVVYHIALEHNDPEKNYAIYANGLLVETCSKRHLKEVSKMELIE